MRNERDLLQLESIGRAAQDKSQLVLIVTGTVTDVPQTFPHSLFLVDYKIHIEYIYYK